MRPEVLRILTFASMAAVLSASYSAFAETWNWGKFQLDGYSSGEALSDKGAVNGSWGEQPVPSGGEVKCNVDDSGRKSMSVNLQESKGDISFKLDSASRWNRQVVDITVIYPDDDADNPPTVPADAQSAFAVVRMGGNSSPDFIGYTAAGWVTLKNDKFGAKLGTWYNVRMSFVKRNGVNLVSYSVKREADSDFVTLRNDDGETLFPRNGASAPTSVGYNGKGAFRDIRFDDNNHGSAAIVR